MTKARARLRKTRRREPKDGDSRVPKWGRWLVELVVLFLILAALRGFISEDSFSARTLVWAGVVAIALTAFNEWQRRRRNSKKNSTN